MDPRNTRFGGGTDRPLSQPAPTNEDSMGVAQGQPMGGQPVGGQPVGEDLSVHRGGSPVPEVQQHAQARISRRTPGPVQSGPAHVGEWLLEFEPATAPDIEPLMGWVSSDDVLSQVRLTFDSLEAAEAYCRRQKLPYTVQAPAGRRRRPRSYADNFVPFEDGTPRPIYPH